MSAPSAGAENVPGQHVTVQQIIDNPLVTSFFHGKNLDKKRTSCDLSVELQSCGRTLVTVDPNFTTDDNTDTEILGWNIFNTIQEAVNAVDDGGTVVVQPGTYTEHVTVGRGILLESGDDFIFEDIGAGVGAPRIVAPDCTALTVEDTDFTVVAGFEIDGNDSGHLCSSPLVDISTETLALFFFDTFEHANTAVNLATDTLSISLLSKFMDNSTAINSESTNILTAHFADYWDDVSGPFEERNNPDGKGGSITGLGAGLVLFRPYLIQYPLTDFGSVFSSTTVSASNIQSLFSNGGTFFSNGDLLEDVSQIIVDENVTIDIPMGNSMSSVYIPGFPSFYFFDTGYTLINHADENFDATQFSADAIKTNTISGIPDNKQPLAAIQFGIPGVQLDVDNGDPITINLFAGRAYNGKTLNVYRSESLHDGWTTDGLVEDSCKVVNGICSFETNSLSYFVATGKRVGGGSVGGSIYSTGRPANVVANASPVVTVKTPENILKLPQFITTLKFGSKGNDVKNLQILLNKNGFPVGSSGAGSLGNETTYFGRATETALIKFQEAHAKEILASFNLTHGTGILGPMTRNLLNSLFGLY